MFCFSNIAFLASTLSHFVIPYVRDEGSVCGPSRKILLSAVQIRNDTSEGQRVLLTPVHLPLLPHRCPSAWFGSILGSRSASAWSSSGDFCPPLAVSCARDAVCGNVALSLLLPVRPSVPDHAPTLRSPYIHEIRCNGGEARANHMRRRDVFAGEGGDQREEEGAATMAGRDCDR